MKKVIFTFEEHDGDRVSLNTSTHFVDTDLAEVLVFFASIIENCKKAIAAALEQEIDDMMEYLKEAKAAEKEARNETRQ